MGPYAVAESVSQDLRFCVAVDGDVSGRVVDVPVVMLDRGSTLTGSVARASCVATPSMALRRGGAEDGVDNGSARRSSEDVYRCSGTVAHLRGHHRCRFQQRPRRVRSCLANFQKFPSQEVGHENPLSFFRDGAS